MNATDATATTAAAATEKHITFVCTGNICRSPMGEGLLRHALKAELPPLCDIAVISCGTAAWHNGEPASVNSVRAMKNVGLDISAHRCQPVSREIVAKSHVIFAMTREHIDVLKYYYPKDLPADTVLMRAFMENETDHEVSDPYGSGLAEYEECRDNMIAAIPSILVFLRKKFGVAAPAPKAAQE